MTAAEDFQRIISQCLSGLMNVINKSDNILMFGKTQEEHDYCLEALLARMEECGLTARIDKCEFSKEKMEFFGYEISAQGIKPTEEKKQAVKSCKRPRSVKEVQSFLGLAGRVLRKFVPQYSTVVETLSSLAKKGSKWVWSHAQESTFLTITRLLEQQLSLFHFDPTI